MGSNPVQAWIFFRPYFHYCLSSAHYCEDHFHSHCLKRMEFSQSPNDAHIYFAWKVNMHIKFAHFGRSLIKQWKVCYSNILKYLLLLYHFLFVKEILPKWWIYLAYFLLKSTCRIIPITKVENWFIHCHVKCVCLCIKMWSKTS